jgi:hypothetical protein
MANVVTQTKPIPRNQLSRITDNHRAMRVFEALAQDVGKTLPDQANEQDATITAQAAIIVAMQGIINAQAAAITALNAAIILKAPIDSPTFTGIVSGITKGMVGLGSVDNISDADKPVSTAQATAIALKASLAGATFTGAVALAGGANLLATTAALTNGAGAALGTITNAPTAGNPTKWVEFDDGGTIRRFPSW